MPVFFLRLEPTVEQELQLEQVTYYISTDEDPTFAVINLLGVSTCKQKYY
jgi:hypothetical protein